jgi:GDP-L-fucose synthase
MNLENKTILVTGASGMVGQALINKLKKINCNLIGTDITFPPFSIDELDYKFVKADLRFFGQCIELTKGVDVVFNTVGIKGSPQMARNNPASFMVPMLQFNTNMLEAARLNSVSWFVYVSSVGVYHPAEVFNEEDVWSTFPSDNDKHPGWAKRMGELQVDAYKIQYGMENISIVRPGNVYGPWDNFDESTAMVIPSLISKSFKNDVLEVFGDGKPIRDFIYSTDVAEGLIFTVENEITEPVNLSSGIPHSIKDVVDIILKYSKKDLSVKWLTEYSNGDSRRLLNMERFNSYGFFPSTSLDVGIKQTMYWYENNISLIKKNNRYDPFGIK